MYHTVDALAFRNGNPIRLPGPGRASRVAIGRRLLDASGTTSTPFDNAGMDTRPFNGSSPAVLWQLLEGSCTSYAVFIVAMTCNWHQ